LRLLFQLTPNKRMEKYGLSDFDYVTIKPSQITKEMLNMTLLIGFAAAVLIAIPFEALAEYVDKHH